MSKLELCKDCGTMKNVNDKGLCGGCSKSISDEKKFRRPFERLSNVDSAKVQQIIVVESLVGEGTDDGSPKRLIKEYFSLDGELLARRDTYLDGALEMGV